MKRLSYIGCTGFMNGIQTQAVYRGSNIALGPDNQLLMVGVLASQRSLRGELCKRTPPMEVTHTIFKADGTLGIVHYHSRERDTDLLSRELLNVREKGGAHCSGLQLNMDLPPPRSLHLYLKEHPDDVLILQVNNKVFERAENNPRKLAEIVAPYFEERLVTHVLLDKSEGKSLPLDVYQTLLFVDALAQRGITKNGEGVVVAGGLYAEKAYTLEPLFWEFPHTSVDAEGELHTGEQKDCFSVDRSVKWVNAVLRLKTSLRRKI